MAELAPAPCKFGSYSDLIGRPFEWKARGPDAFDCYGLFIEMARRTGMVVPELATPVVNSLDAAPHIAAQIPLWVPCEKGPGALVALRIGQYVGHVGWMLPYDQMLHCWKSAGGVCVEPLSNWERRVVGFYRWGRE